MAQLDFQAGQEVGGGSGDFGQAVFQPGGGRTELGQPGPGQIGRDGELTVVTQMFWHRDKWLSPSIRTFLDMVREVVKTGDVLERIERRVIN